MVEYTDKIVGRVVNKLDELGIREDTILLFTGDNGSPGGQHNTSQGTQRGGKGAMTDDGTRVPLVVSWPNGGASGRVREDLIDFSDFLPTFAEAEGVPVFADRKIDGRSFLPQLKGEKGQPREWAFCHFWGAKGRTKEGARSWIRTHRYKLYDNGEFFDLDADNGETSPITAPQGEAAKVMQFLKTEMKKVLS